MCCRTSQCWVTSWDRNLFPTNKVVSKQIFFPSLKTILSTHLSFYNISLWIWKRNSSSMVKVERLSAPCRHWEKSLSWLWLWDLSHCRLRESSCCPIFFLNVKKCWIPKLTGNNRRLSAAHDTQFWWIHPEFFSHEFLLAMASTDYNWGFTVQRSRSGIIPQITKVSKLGEFQQSQPNLNQFASNLNHS